MRLLKRAALWKLNFGELRISLR